MHCNGNFIVRIHRNRCYFSKEEKKNQIPSLSGYMAQHRIMNKTVCKKAYHLPAPSICCPTVFLHVSLTRDKTILLVYVQIGQEPEV